MRISLLTVFLLATCTLCHAQQPMSEADIKALVRDSVRFLDQKNNKSEQYAYTIRRSRKQFDSGGKPTLDETIVMKRTFEDGLTITRPVERNGKPIPEDERKRNEEQLAARLAELKGMSEAQREAQRKKSRQQDEWAKEVPEALKYRVTGEDTLDGRKCWVLDAEPNPNYRPANMQARVFEKMKGKFWVDKADRELVRGEAETFDTVNMGLGVLARIEKGTRFALHRIKLPDGNWVTESEHLKFGARVMLFKWMSSEMDTRMSDFRHKSQFTASAAR